jgi:hypothetical protein
VGDPTTGDPAKPNATTTSSTSATATPPGPPPAPLGPGCDDDNAITSAPTASDLPLPDEIIQFERQWNWGCAHREYHETRQWDYIAADTAQPQRLAYLQKMNWKRAAVQEGAVGSGLDFLAMHRAMLGTLIDRFPAHASLFSGWTTVPTVSTAADPVPADSTQAGAFWTTMTAAISRLETDLGSFSSEDDLGRFIETQHRPTDADPFARDADKSAGLHTYVHVRFDDAKSPIRMQRFGRNLESETFFRLHGWIDRLWTQWRQLHGLGDSDPAYAAAMDHHCMHMGFTHWDAARSACLP